MRRSACAAGLLLAVTMLVCAPMALAVFNKTVVGGPLTIATSTLAAPGKAIATQINCRANKNPEIEVNWYATSSTYASSYTVERAPTSAGPYTAVSSLPTSETSYTDKSGSLTYSTTYYYRVSAIYHSWSATSASTTVKTLSKFCV